MSQNFNSISTIKNLLAYDPGCFSCLSNILDDLRTVDASCRKRLANCYQEDVAGSYMRSSMVALYYLYLNPRSNNQSEGLRVSSSSEPRRFHVKSDVNISPGNESSTKDAKGTLIIRFHHRLFGTPNRCREPMVLSPILLAPMILDLFHLASIILRPLLIGQEGRTSTPCRASLCPQQCIRWPKPKHEVRKSF